MRKRGKYCLHCGDEFDKPFMGKKYCCVSCKVMAWQQRKRKAELRKSGNTAKLAKIKKEIPEGMDNVERLKWLEAHKK